MTPGAEPTTGPAKEFMARCLDDVEGVILMKISGNTVEVRLRKVLH